METFPKECERLFANPNGSFDLDDSGSFAGSGPVSAFLKWIFPAAAEMGASDIYFSDRESGVEVRMRHKNMQLERMCFLSKAAGREIFSAISAKCRTSDKESENIQDGSFFVLINNGFGFINIRVNFLPTIFGRNIVCRILDQSNSGRKLDTVYMPPDVKESVLNTLSQDQGMVIVSGPTGSGKTSTLYSFLNHLNTPDKHIVTAEDPVEYFLPGADQVNIHRHFRPFDQVLRAFLRQDPDIILVGEIRDGETAETAVTAANTGHLLLSTIHANDALSTVIRLTKLGVERFALADALSAFFAQRLLNQLCPHCRCEIRQPESTARAWEKTRFPADAYYTKGSGCEYCNGKGVIGRIPVMEFVVRNEEIRQSILTDDFMRLEKAMLAQEQYKTLIEAGLQMSEQGLVDFQDALALGVR